jgi:hypothetical protein
MLSNITIRDTEAATRAFMDCPDGGRDPWRRRREVGAVNIEGSEG